MVFILPDHKALFREGGISYRVGWLISHNFVWCNHLFCPYMENVMTQPCHQGVVTCNQPTQCQGQSGPTSEA